MEVNEFLDELVEEIKVAPKLYYQFKKFQAENKRLKTKLKNCICPHCGFGFEQALKGK